MSLSLIGSCPRCGAPIYVPTGWFSVLPPTPQYSCPCFQTNKSIAVLSTTTNPPQKQTDTNTNSLLREINTNLKELVILVKALVQQQEQEVDTMASGRISRFRKEKEGKDGPGILCG